MWRRGSGVIVDINGSVATKEVLGGRMETENIADTGGFYSVDAAGQRIVYDCFRDAVKGAATKGRLGIDVVALTEVPAHYAFIGDKTLISSIRRTPWFAKCPPAENGVEYGTPPHHGSRKASCREIAEELYVALRREIAEYVKGSKTIGILLSGGMDSRVVASVLKEIQKETSGFTVVALCWGNPNSRDPVYAKRIAERYDWDCRHFAVTCDTLKENIEVCADEGCFCSPGHLHAMPAVARSVRELGVECVLAGSYGDSIGRAEYSGVRVENLCPLKRCLRNWFGLIRPGVYAACRRQSLREIERYHVRFAGRNTRAVRELDYQLHYMRNMLGTCMSILNRATRLRQVFTHNCVVSLMWSLANPCRTNEVYKELLCRVDAALLDVPWARTGKRYLDECGEPDGLAKSFHEYSEWVRHELASYIEETIFDGELEKTGVFNMDQVRFVVAQNRKARMIHGRMEEIILWLSSLSAFLRKSDWRIEWCEPRMSLSSLAGRVETALYLVRHRWKNA